MLPTVCAVTAVYAGLAGLLGVIVGAAELTSRYRDEPQQALLSNAGLNYLLLNGTMSVAVYGLLTRYSQGIFPEISNDQLMTSIVAGFGAMAVLRSKFFTIRTDQGEDISVGPDAAVSAFLNAADRGVDRARASRRLALVFRRAGRIADPSRGREFIEISLAAFQNLSRDDKANFVGLLGTITDSRYPEALKLQAICYAMLSFTGEKNFNDIMTNLEEYTQSTANNPAPESPLEPPAQPLESPLEPPAQPLESPLEPPENDVGPPPNT